MILKFIALPAVVLQRKPHNVLLPIVSLVRNVGDFMRHVNAIVINVITLQYYCY